MNFLDLFSGIGGFRLGLEKAGHKCIDIFLHDFKRLLVHLQPHQLLKPIVYIIHKSPPMVMDTPFYKEYSCFVLD